MKKILDISIEISPQTVLWENDPRINIESVQKIKEGAEFGVTRLEMGVHNGSHIDAPSHFIEKGKSVDQIPLEVLVGPAQVIEIDDSIHQITAQVLKNAKITISIKKVLLKTRNSKYWHTKSNEFKRDFAGIVSNGAEYLVRSGIELVGIDYLSISPFDDLYEPHRILLRNGVVILEAIDLSAVESGVYDLYCLPLKLKGVEGAPVRAILVQDL